MPTQVIFQNVEFIIFSADFFNSPLALLKKNYDDAPRGLSPTLLAKMSLPVTPRVRGDSDYL
jgi:hypothetical protein